MFFQLTADLRCRRRARSRVKHVSTHTQMFPSVNLATTQTSSAGSTMSCEQGEGRAGRRENPPTVKLELTLAPDLRNTLTSLLQLSLPGE